MPSSKASSTDFIIQTTGQIASLAKDVEFIKGQHIQTQLTMGEIKAKVDSLGTESAKMGWVPKVVAGAVSLILTSVLVAILSLVIQSNKKSNEPIRVEVTTSTDGEKKTTVSNP